MDKIGFLFDLDGVLIDSEKEYTKIWTEINKAFPTGKDNLAYIIKGQTLNQILTEHFTEDDRQGVTDMLHTLEKEMVYSYCRHAANFLETLKMCKIKVAVVTSSDNVKMEHLYKDLPDFREKVAIIIDASQVEKSKPDPEGYLKGALSLGVNIKNCVVFEDSVQGVIAGKAAGAYVVGIIGTKSKEELLPYSDLLVNSLEEIELKELITVLKNR